LPLLLKPDGKGKLSKRDGDRLGFPVFPCNWHNPDGELYPGFREWGYLPQAFINMLALLGWNPGTEQELFSLNELVELFSIERVNKSGARFDPEKAKWFNQQYLKKLSNAELSELLKPIIAEKGIKTNPDTLDKVIGMLKDRAVFPQDIVNEGIYFFQKPLQYDNAAIKKRIKPAAIPFLELLINEFNHCTFVNQELENTMNDFCQQHQLGLGEIMIPIRIALVGTTKGPHLGEIMEVLGKEESIERITAFISYLKQFAF